MVVCLLLIQIERDQKQERIRVKDGNGSSGRTHEQAANVFEVGVISKFHLQLLRIQARLSIVYT